MVCCWGSEEIYGLDKPSSFSKLNINGWTDNLIKMHNSFDILLSTSQFETFGLVVAEALSAGIPCVLSDIPVYRELYSDCKGVVFLTGDDKKDIEAINQLLEHAEILKQDIQKFWQVLIASLMDSTETSIQAPKRQKKRIASQPLTKVRN